MRVLRGLRVIIGIYWIVLGLAALFGYATIQPLVGALLAIGLGLEFVFPNEGGR